MPTGNPPEFATITTAVTPGPVPQSPGGFQRPGPSRRLPHQQSDAGGFNSQHAARPPLKREQSQIQQAIASSAAFVGIPYAERSPDLSDWDSRRLRFLNKRYKLKESVVKQVHQQHEAMDSTTPTVIDTPSADMRFGLAGPPLFMRSTSQESRPRLEKKDSVLRVAYDTVSSFIKRGTVSRPKPRKAPLAARSSFDAADLDDSALPPVMALPSPTIETVPEEAEQMDEELQAASEEKPVGSDGEAIPLEDLERPTSLSGGRPIPVNMRRRWWGVDSLPILYDEEGNPMARPRHCFAQLAASSGPECEPLLEGEKSELKDAKVPRKTKSWSAPPQKEEAVPLTKEQFISGIRDSKERTFLPVPYEGIGLLDVGSARIHPPPDRVPLAPSVQPRAGEPDRPPERKPSRIQRQTHVEENDARLPVKHLLDSIATGIVPRRQRRYRGVGPIGRLFNHHMGKNEVKKLDPKLQQMLEQGEDHRPLFTYWVTTVQIVVCVVSLLTYGIGPFGFFERIERTEEVPDVSLASRRVSYHEPVNIWLGPSFQDLVHLGAKYSPCMRRERGVWKGIEMERRKENETACCVFNDRHASSKAGCYQTTEIGCPRNLATWMKWSKQRPNKLSRSKSDSHLLSHYNNSDVAIFNTIPHPTRSAGAVCGQDPDFCIVPRSQKPREWPDDLTKWPICRESRTEGTLPKNMNCQLTGRPCCIQMQGLCRITTKEYCDFVQGYWHSNATLCSQVDCFGDICGMLPFVNKDHPNQFYRLFTSLFIHAGVIHLAITIVVHRVFMVDLEALIGWKRMAIVYIGSGVGGNLASAIFVPYNPEVGPSGSQLGILAAMIVDVYHHRSLITDWHRAVIWHLVAVFGLFIAGIFPFVDNWAHIFGFIFGLLITMSVFPYIDFISNETMGMADLDEEGVVHKGRLTVTRRKILVMISIISGCLLFALLCFVYFSNYEINCPYCGYLNCVNILMTDHYCDNKGLELSHWLPI